MRRFPHLNRHGHDAMKNPETNCFRVFLAPPVRLELTTLRLTAECSAIELRRNRWRGFEPLQMGSGGDLCSRAVSSQVLSALKGLTSVFGMGTGGTPSPLPPEIVSLYRAIAFIRTARIPNPRSPSGASRTATRAALSQSRYLSPLLRTLTTAQ